MDDTGNDFHQAAEVASVPGAALPPLDQRER